MEKYEVKWCRIWDFTEKVEVEAEEEVYEKILEERKTAGSTIEIISVMPIDIEEIKQKEKKERMESAEVHKRARKAEKKIVVETLSTNIPKEEKEKK